MKEYSNAQLLFSSYKTRAFRADQYSSNHKVRSEVEDTHEADSHFDEITLYKGASLLNYLYNLTGEKEFFTCLKNYLSANLQKGLVNFDSFSKQFGSNKNNFDVFTKFLDNEGLVKLDCVRNNLL